MLPYPPDRVDAAIEQACRECQLDLTYASSIYAYLEEDEDCWPACCGSSCEPCVLQLSTVARRALSILESDPAAKKAQAGSRS
jgi:hypothetical protein